MKELIDLQNNATQRDGLKAFMLTTLKDLAGEKALRGESTAGFAEANLLVNVLFEKLDELNRK